MIQKNRYDRLYDEYRYTSSWTLWADANPDEPKSNIEDLGAFSNPQIHNELNSDYIFVALNPAEHNRFNVSEPWSAFHSTDKKRSQDYKLRYALKNTKFWGSFITDIYPAVIETDSGLVQQKVNQEQMKESVAKIEKICDILGDPVVIAIGSKSYSILLKYMSEKHRLKRITHYSSYIGKETYRTKVAEELKDI